MMSNCPTRSRASKLRLLPLAIALVAIAHAPAAEVVPSSDEVFRSGACHASLTDGLLRMGNGVIERTWRVEPTGELTALALTDLPNRVDWIVPADMSARPVLASILTAEDGKAGPTEEASLRATLVVNTDQGAVTHRFQIFDDVPAIAQERTVSRGTSEIAADRLARLSLLESFVPAPKDLEMTVVKFHGKTDLFEGPLVVEREATTDPIPVENPDAARTYESSRFRGNVFFMENPSSGCGLLFLKHAPLPDERPRAIDLEGVLVRRLFDFWRRDGRIDVQSHEFDNTGGTSYRTVTLLYGGGRAGRIATLQRYHRQLRTYEPDRDGLILCNAWGEWNSSQNLSEAFLDKEIPAAARLGVDVFQIDAGWQAAAYPGTLDKKSRQAIGHYGISPDYWAVHPKKFPEGLSRYVRQIKSLNMKAGIWIAPESVNDLVLYPKDKARVLELFRDGFTYFKFDLLRIHTPIAEGRIQRLIEEVINETGGRLTIDLDVTDGHTPRPGYFGNPHHGPIFVENRWTHYPAQPPEPTTSEYWPRKDRYWPHRTLRNLWLIGQYMDPLRLRMEFMNNLRQQDKYGDDPLAPAQWSPAYVFATVMCSSPLAWMEVQQLPEIYVQQVAPLVKVWKAHREAMFKGSLVPVGDEPNGRAWTGFISANQKRDGGYALLFRELNEHSSWTTDLPLLRAGNYEAVLLAGDGKVTIAGGRLTAEIPAARQFVFVELRRK